MVYMFRTSTKPVDSAARILTSRRHAAGRQHLAAVLNWWIGRSSFTLRTFSQIASWCTGENKILIHSQISHLRNGNIRAPGLINLDAFHQVNVAVYRWHIHGHSACIRAYGPHRTHGIEDSDLDRAVWLHHPDHPTEPLDFGDWAEIVAGYLVLPYVGEINVSPGQAKELSQRIAKLLEGFANASGLGVRGGLEAVLAAYPAQDPARRARLRALIVGTTDFSDDELRDELWDMAVTVSTLRGQPPEALTASQFLSELTTDRRRS